MCIDRECQTDLFWRFDGSSVPVDDFIQRVIEERGFADGSEQIVRFRQRFGGSFAALRVGRSGRFRFAAALLTGLMTVRITAAVAQIIKTHEEITALCILLIAHGGRRRERLSDSMILG